MVISYTIKEITDDVGYLTALGQGRTAEVQRDARIGEAKAKMESSIAEAKVSLKRAEHFPACSLETSLEQLCLAEFSGEQARPK